MTDKEFTERTGIALDTPEKYAHMQLMYVSTGFDPDTFCKARALHQKVWTARREKLLSIKGRETGPAALLRFIEGEIDRPSAGFLKLAALQK